MPTVFADPRSGADRRKQSGRALAHDQDQRLHKDRRTIRRGGDRKEWWLLRHYVTAEIITGGRRPD